MFARALKPPGLGHRQAMTFSKGQLIGFPHRLTAVETSAALFQEGRVTRVFEGSTFDHREFSKCS